MNAEEDWTMDNSSLVYNFSIIFPTILSVEREYFAEEKHDYAVDDSTVDSFLDFCSSKTLRETVIACITFAVSVFGLLGNGTVVWLLGFRMKGNRFTTYILNLAVADFGVLILSLIVAIYNIVPMHAARWTDWYLYVRDCLLHFAYSTSQFLLTTISIDRCVTVLFPIWYRCRRPKTLSAVVCAVIWILSFLVLGIIHAIEMTREVFSPHNVSFYSRNRFIVILVNSVVCLTSITIATLILFVKFCFKSQQRKRGRLLMAILLTLFFFLIFAFPINVIYLISYNRMHSTKDRDNISCYSVLQYSLLCVSLNSFVNPLLYFLVGRKKRGLCGENLKLIFRRVFIEEEETSSREEPGIQI